MFKKKSKNISAAAEEAKKLPKTRDVNFNWDMEVRFEQAKSEARAWVITKILFGLCAALILAVVMLTPLKTVQPYVIRVDTSSGVTDVVTMHDFKLTNKDEVIIKYFLNKFIVARESYHFAQLEEDFYTTRELATPEVFNEYNKLFAGKDNIQKTLKNKTRIDVKVSSITNNIDTKTADIRFSKTWFDITNNTEMRSEHWIARCAYDFYPEISTTEKRRLINPLGFKVTSYRLNPEIDGGK